MISNCNNCDIRGCDSAKSVAEMEVCSKYLQPVEGFKLIELASTYPDSLNKSLSRLKFKVRIKDYI